jgi:choline dehydrogenase-like flavoprotein
LKHHIVDLTCNAVGPDETKYDFCIIGAGAAGLFLATQLAARGMRTLVLEAGPKLGVSAKDIGFAPNFLSDYYPGAIEGRSFGLGGSTSRWGGLLIPHSSFDLRPKTTDPYGSTWKRILEIVSAQGRKVLDTLGYPFPVEFETFSANVLGTRHQLLSKAGFGVQSSIFLPFAKKNLVQLLKSKVTNKHPIQIYVNAVAKDWELDFSPNYPSRLCAVTAVCNKGNRHRISAGRFILAAGALETARILLEIQSQHAAKLTLSKQIGMFLGDHLSIAIAEVAKDSQKIANKIFAPRFQSVWMRSFRFLDQEITESDPRAFAHFVFDNQNPGFLLAKKFLGGVQARKFPKLSLSEILSGLTGLTKLATDRYLKSRLYIPSVTTARFQLDIEQNPTKENRISLGSEKDSYQRPLVNINWRIGEMEIHRIRSLATKLIKRWNAIGDGIPQLVPNELSENSQKPHDAYHPVGVCRMGDDAESVVDHDLKVRGVDNLWCVTTGVFPTAGTANPTFSMLCLGLDLVERLLVD